MGVHMAYERFYELERQFREIGERIDFTSDAADLYVLNVLQEDILAESLQIIRQLTVPEKWN
jgi:hypothetical protein